MLPDQDHMPEGGVGNLIALPLQGQALKNGNSAFIDEKWNAYPNQWNVDKSENEESRPWEKKKQRFELSDVNGVLNMTLANQIYIDIENVKPRLQNQIRRLAAFSNPEFYKNQAMGFSTQGTVRIISCSQDVIIYDYVDSHIRVLERMYHKRLRAYKKIGYEICLALTDKKQIANAIYDNESYGTIYEKDLLEANNNIIISSPGINEKKVKRIISYIRKRQELNDVKNYMVL